MSQKTSNDLDRSTVEPADEADRKAGRPGDKPYSGVLAQPIVIDWKKDDFAAGLLMNYEKKIAALFDHFQLEHGNFRGLALALAHRHVPGFRIQKLAGAPQRWSLRQQARLLHEVHRYRAGKHGSGASVTAACRHIAAAGTFGKASAGALERRYYAAVKNEKFEGFAKHITDLEASGTPVVRDELVAFILDTFLRK